MYKYFVSLLLVITLCAFYSCRCWYKSGAMQVQLLSYKTTNSGYFSTQVIAIKYPVSDYSTPLDTQNLGDLYNSASPGSRVLFTIGDEEQAKFDYVFVVGDTLRRDTVSDIQLVLKGPKCDPRVKSLDFLFNGQRTGSKEVVVQ